MKKFILIFTVTALLISAFTFGAFATEVSDITTAAEPAEAVTEPESITKAEALTEAPTEAQSEPADATEATAPEDSGEETIPLDEFLLRLWEEYRDSIFAALSTVFSLVVAVVLKNKYIPGINREIKVVAASQGDQGKMLEAFTEETKQTLAAVGEKLKTFEDYDKLSKDMKQVLAEAQLDRRVLIKTIEMQADQIEHLIEYSHLSQARKDQLYEGYRAQLEEIKKLKGEGELEA